MKSKEPSKAFTILEIVIAIAVILILAAAALSGSGGIIRSMRFSNAFNKIVFLTQEAGSRALNGKNTEVASYEMKFTTANPPYKAEFITNTTSTSSPNVNESLSFDSTSKLILSAEAGNSLCNSSAGILFKNGKTDIILFCDDAEVEATENLKISLSEEGTNRKKSFILNKKSGLPQISAAD